MRFMELVPEAAKHWGRMFYHRESFHCWIQLNPSSQPVPFRVTWRRLEQVEDVERIRKEPMRVLDVHASIA